jgi:NarL family two-component system response regulator LiaR
MEEGKHMLAFGSSREIRVMIVDDHPILRRGLRLSLLTFPEFEVVGEAGTGEESVHLAEQIRPDVILMDLMMPGTGGIPAIRAIHAVAPETRVMVLSTFDDGELVQDAFQAGAIGYQLKGLPIDELVKAIRLTAANITNLAPIAAKRLAENTRTTPKVGEDLSKREREVLMFLVQGFSNAAIAETLFITVATVKFHLRSIRSKLGTATRTETVALAIRSRIVPAD